ncbi:MAG: hypothetical protein WC956_07335 [bacterium]
MIKLQLPKISLGQVLTLREKAIFVLALLGMLVFFLNTLWSPIGNKITSQKEELKGLQAQVDSLRTLIDSAQAQLNIQVQQPHEEAKIDQRSKLMLGRRVVDPLAEIHSTVSAFSSRNLARNVKIGDVKIGEMVEKDAYSMVPLAIHLQGRPGAVVSFFSMLEVFDKPLVVRRFSVKGEPSSGGLVKASIDAELYIIKR